MEDERICSGVRKAMLCWRRVVARLIVALCVSGGVNTLSAGYYFGPSITGHITLNPNGGTVSPTTLEVTLTSSSTHGSYNMATPYTGTLGDLPTPEYAGHTFLGWFTAASGGSQVSKGTTISTTSSSYSVTYYAHWRLNVYVIRFLPNGGTGTMADQTVTHGVAQTLSSNVFRRTGYSFAGWDVPDGTVVGDQASLAPTLNTDGETLELTARWDAKNYCVTFDANGGEASTAQKNVKYDDSYGSLPSASRSGYSFAGWWTGADGGTRVTERSAVTTAANHSLYAHWTAKAYTVAFDANGGAVSVASKSVKFNEMYGELPVPSREDYSFTGWHTKAKGGDIVEATTVMAKTSAHTLYAQWSPILTNAYLVKLHRNYDGSHGDVIEERVFKIGKSISLPTIDGLGWGREGCQFLGWVLGTGTSVSAYADGQTVQDLAKTPGATIHLYAGWR